MKALNTDQINLAINLFNQKINNQNALKKHSMLITLYGHLIDYVDHSDNVYSHDVLIRVDKNEAGYISELIFADLQETGIYKIDHDKENTTTIDYNKTFKNLIEVSFNNYAIVLFGEISVIYNVNDIET